MIAKICLVTLLSCVLTRANPVSSEYESTGSKLVLDHEVKGHDNTVAAVPDGSDNFVAGLIESVIKGVLKTVADMLSMDIRRTHFVPPQIEKMVKDMTADVMQVARKARVFATQAAKKGRQVGHLLIEAATGFENDPIDTVDNSTESNTFLS